MRNVESILHLVLMTEDFQSALVFTFSPGDVLFLRDSQ